MWSLQSVLGSLLLARKLSLSLWFWDLGPNMPIRLDAPHLEWTEDLTLYVSCEVNMRIPYELELRRFEIFGRGKAFLEFEDIDHFADVLEEAHLIWPYDPSGDPNNQASVQDYACFTLLGRLQEVHEDAAVHWLRDVCKGCGQLVDHLASLGWSRCITTAERYRRGCRVVTYTMRKLHEL
jgi:hypothetical protein